MTNDFEVNPKPIEPHPQAFGNLFHVTAHAVGRENLFRADVDKREFIGRFRNYLDPDDFRNSSRHGYEKLHDEVAMVTFGLIDNHFHLIMQEIVRGALRNLMHRTQTSYARYYNDKYEGRGRLFDRPFKPTPIVDSAHAKRAIAYVHLNDVIEQLDYPFTGHRLFTRQDHVPWIKSETGLQLYGGVNGYKAYLNEEGPDIIDRKLKKAGLCRVTYKFRPIT